MRMGVWVRGTGYPDPFTIIYEESPVTLGSNLLTDNAEVYTMGNLSFPQIVSILL